MKVCLYDIKESQFVAYSVNNDFPSILYDDTYINNVISIAFIIRKTLAPHVNDRSLDCLQEPLMQSIMKKVSYLISYDSSTAYVPFPNLFPNFSFDPSPSIKNSLEERFELNKSLSISDFQRFDFYPNPDYIFLHCMDHFPWSGLSESLYGGFYIKGTEKWNHYYPPYNQFPSDQALLNAKGVVITGSFHSAYDNDEWINFLSQIIQKCLEQKIRLVGICFGHQLLGRALGGSAGPNPSGRKVSKFETIVKENGKKYKIMETHNDCVTKIPENSRVLFRSETCETEVLLVGDSVLGIQGHPEFLPYLVKGMNYEFGKDDHEIEFDAYEDSVTLIEGLNTFLRTGEIVF